jgi:serine/threonine-protein kinase RsbW
LTSGAELEAAEAAGEMAERAGFTQDEGEEIKLALIEACINAIEHSKSQDATIQIHFEIHPDRLSIQVSDAGSGFDPDEVIDKIAASRLAGTKTRGWGLTLIKELMDEVVFDSNSQGTRITMQKNRP